MMELYRELEMEEWTWNEPVRLNVWPMPCKRA